MPYRKNQTNAQIVPLALAGGEGQTKTGAMSVDRYRVGFPRTTPYQGSLPKSWARLLSDRFGAGRIEAVIYSYSTPIAWLDADYGWIIPIVRYSTTTSSKHQTHLYRLGGRHIYMPWDATTEDAQRVLSGELSFVCDSKGRAVATVPGPNYISGIVAVGERIRFRDVRGAIRVGVITRKGSIAGWADVNGTEVRFDDYAIMTGGI